MRSQIDFNKIEIFIATLCRRTFLAVLGTHHGYSIAD